MKFKKLVVLLLVIVMTCSMFSGCRKPYDTPEFITVEASQTAFLIPLIGDTTQQSVFESEELLWELEEICEQHDIPWGDTICEGCTWEEYTDARNNLGLGELRYYGDVK